MDEDREAVIRSIANLWTFHGAFIARLLEMLEECGAATPAALEQMLQALDEDTDEILEGQDDKLYAAGLLAVARQRLAARRGGPSGGRAGG